MSSDEKKQILKMVADGKINADQAMHLIKVLEQSSAEVELIEAAPHVASSAPNPAGTATPEFEKIAARARRLWQIPLWIGVGFTVLTSYWLYNLVRTQNFGFWFYFAWLPFLLGVLIIAVSSASRTSRWLFVKVQQAEGEWPRNIVLGFPLPLGWAAWVLRNFGYMFTGLDNNRVDDILEILSGGLLSKEPLIVNVDEGDDGERVQVYIG